ncbi:MAG: DUF3099 domain-containing protein [Actinomycetales bacterium]|nr:DUF3099 domain-containing protein [Actinomycetales bacterium]
MRRAVRQQATEQGAASGPSGGEVFAITTAAPSLGDDQAARTRRYLVSMGIRVGCFIGAILADGWLRWALVVGAIVLPYIAVVIANAGRESGRRTVAAFTFQRHRALPAAQPIPRDLQ